MRSPESKTNRDAAYMMNLFQIATVLITLSALFSYLNFQYIPAALVVCGGRFACDIDHLIGAMD